MGDCLPPRIAFSVFCKHSVSQQIMNGIHDRLVFEQLTQAPFNARRIRKRSWQIWKMMAYEVPCSRSLGEVLRRVFLASRHLPASLLDQTATEVTASRELAGAPCGEDVDAGKDGRGK
jgi:hypothetical protein